MEGNHLWIFQLIGQAHPLIVDFPIGLLFLGLLGVRGKQESFFNDQDFRSQNISKENDMILWANFKTGCLKSYEQIYRDHVQDMFNYGMTIVHNESQVKDCIQELFFEIWKARKNLSPTKNIRFYLLKSLRYKIKHSIIKEAKRKNVAYQSHSTEIKILFPFEDESIGDEELKVVMKKIEIALKKLTSRQREVITLIFFEGMTYEEVATIMSISVGSIYTLAWKAISRLKKAVI